MEDEVDKINKMIREHTSYYIGKTRVSSVTTIIDGNLGWKWPALMGWTKKMMRQGLDPDAVKTEAGTVGTLVHAMIQAHLTERDVDYAFFSADQQKQAQTAFGGFLDWYNENRVKPIEVEDPIVHKSLRYGGTLDLYCMMNSKRTLVDFKSATAVYLDHRIQLAAYEQLALHRYKKPVKLIILHINKETGVATPHPFAQLIKEWEVFKLCLRLEKIHKHLK